MAALGFLAAGGILLGLLVIAALLARGDGNRQANLLLAASLSCTVGYLGLVVAMSNGVVDNWPWLKLLAYPYVLASPLLYGYVRVMTDRGFRLGWDHLLHLWPLAVMLLVSLSGGGDSQLTADAMERARGGWPPNRAALIGILLYSVSSLYLTAAFLRVRNHRRDLLQEFSHERKVTLRWLQVLVGVLLLMAVSGLVIALARLLPGVELWPRSIFSTLTVVVTFYLIAFFGLSQPDVFAGERKRPGPQEGRGRHPSSVLQEADVQQLWRQLTDFMEREQPYLEHELRIAKLAQQVGMGTGQLSQVINRCAGKNFFDFVSAYRVERAKELLAGSPASMARIAQDSGFNSQSAFYRQFRKVCGLAPKAYQRQLAGPDQ